jgi:Plasmid stabilisation system protein.
MPGTGEAELPEPEEQPVVYAVRVSARAERDAFEALAYLEESAGPEVASEWYRGFVQARSSLSRYPGRFAVQVAESRLMGFEVRRLLYRRPGSRNSAAGYHLYYLVREESDDGPVVLVFHVRHASRRPLTAAEAPALRADL